MRYSALTGQNTAMSERGARIVRRRDSIDSSISGVSRGANGWQTQQSGGSRKMGRDTSNRAKEGFATRAIHVGYRPADESGALTPPVFMTSTYAFETAEVGEEIFRGEREGYVYGRTRNPTQALFEERFASLESAEAGLAVASGMAAISSTLWTLLPAGDQVVIDHTLYGNSFVLFVRGLTRFGVKVVVADFTDLDAVEAAVSLGAPKLVFFESPANPNLRIIDTVSYTHLRAHETRHDLVCRLLLET